MRVYLPRRSYPSRYVPPSSNSEGEKGARGFLERARFHRKPIDRVTSLARDIDRDATRKNKGLTTVGLLHGRGTVCPIRSDRYCTPPYNLHGLMTSITLLRASVRASDRSRRRPLVSATVPIRDSLPARTQSARNTRAASHLYGCSRGRGCGFCHAPRHLHFIGNAFRNSACEISFSLFFSPL